jgi:hypothetical protein
VALSASLRPLLHALAETIVPGSAALDEVGWAALERTVGTAIAARPPRLQRQLRLFLRLIEWLPVLRYGRSFTALGPARRHQFLSALENAPLLLVRRGFWGLRTLILMGYYTHAQVVAAIGYRADPRGWKVRR